jgi:hypothetical protein
MKKTNFMTSMSRSLHKAGFQLKKHSPEILIVAGVVGAVTSTVMACKATLKVNDVLDKAKKDINNIHDVAADVEAGIRPASEYTPEDQKKDLTIVYTKTGFELVKLYAPAVVVGALSVVSLISSHRILKKRNVALAAAYATVDKGFKEYRGRVIERFGKELDRELKYNIRAKEIEEKVIDENGNETTVTKTVNVADPNLTSDYARFFDETCVGWEKDPEYNLRFLKLQQAYANEKLKCQGHLFLNEVYDMLGLPRTQAGQAVGWIYDEENPIGDNFVDFGIYDLYDERKRAFVNGHERSILLDFNVDGDIWSLMK